jgi:8-oxo-dGTP pyrophosphatase MutT (NUDIX family)
LQETAIRETFEEISVRVDENDVIGSLSPLTIPVSQFTVYPFLALLPHTPEYKPDENEVVGIIEYDVWEFIHHATIDIYKVKVANTELEAPAFNINGHIVWGATAMILNEFREIMLEVLNNHNPL